MSTWQKAGFSINKYLTISARTVEKALKAEFKKDSEKRYASELIVQTIKGGEVVKAVDLQTGKELPL